MNGTERSGEGRKCSGSLKITKLSKQMMWAVPLRMGMPRVHVTRNWYSQSLSLVSPSAHSPVITFEWYPKSRLQNLQTLSIVFLCNLPLQTQAEAGRLLLPYAHWADSSHCICSSNLLILLHPFPECLFQEQEWYFLILVDLVVYYSSGSQLNVEQWEMSMRGLGVCPYWTQDSSEVDHTAA